MAAFIIITMNIFDSGESYYYEKVWRKKYGDHSNSNLKVLEMGSDAAGPLDDDIFGEYKNQGMHEE